MSKHLGEPQSHILIVGSGTHFISGISYYTFHLMAALKTEFSTSAILMRRLIPKSFYPGKTRVGSPITALHASSLGPTFDGVDWYIWPSLFRSVRFLRQQKPDVVIFQWWTGAVLLSYLCLSRVARRQGSSIILEFHESQDTGEAGIPLVERIVRPGLLHLVNTADHYVVHSEWDKDRLAVGLSLDPGLVSVIPHGPYPIDGVPQDQTSSLQSVCLAEGTVSPQGRRTVTILFFGTVRPYKGLEDLVDAFDLLPRDGVIDWQLLAVGETWQGWVSPAIKIAESRYGSDIEFVNRYVDDSEIAGFFERSDIVALPYRRSSASGPLHMTMQSGRPVVITNVGGLSEAAAGYSGTCFVEPANPKSLAEGIVAALGLIDLRHTDLHSWDTTRAAFEEIFSRLSE